jgi:hypothetical protein
LPAASALRLEIEELASELNVRRPELIATNGEDLYLEAVHYASLALQLLTYHATVARPSKTRASDLLAMRDAMMAHNLSILPAASDSAAVCLPSPTMLISNMERWPGSGGPDLIEWCPAGAHLGVRLGPRYAVIGTGVGASETHGIAAPDAGSLEAILAATPGPARFTPTWWPIIRRGCARRDPNARSSKEPRLFPVQRQKPH